MKLYQIIHVIYETYGTYTERCEIFANEDNAKKHIEEYMKMKESDPEDLFGMSIDEYYQLYNDAENALPSDCDVDDIHIHIGEKIGKTLEEMQKLNHKVDCYLQNEDRPYIDIIETAD